MTDEERALSVDLAPKAIAALTDALAPLMSRKGISAVTLVAMVSLGEDRGFPVVVTLGTGTGPIQAANRALARLVEEGDGPQFDVHQLSIAMPAKN